MNIGLFSISFINTPIEIREKIKFTSKYYKRAYQWFLAGSNSCFAEMVILSTCNRTEIYYMFTDADFGETVSGLKELLTGLFGLDNNYLDKYAVSCQGTEAVDHLFQVAAGLKSQVIGEQQILGQVKGAQELAMEYQVSSKYLNRIFREAITTAKEVRSRTGLSDKNLSLSSVAVSFMEERFTELEGKEVLVIGVGKMSRMVLKLLKDKGISRVYATNRTHGKVVDISKIYDGVIPVRYSELHQVAAGVDIIISSTSAPHYVVHPTKFKRYFRGKKNGGMVIIDLGVPRDIDPVIGDLPGIDIYNIDVLTEQLEINKNYRLGQADEAREIIREGIASIREWLTWQKVVPVIKEIKQSNAEIVEEELTDLFSRIEVNGDTREELSEFGEHLSNKLFNYIILNLKQLALEKDDDGFIHTVNNIFGVKE